jgi:hypothetical protein
MRKHARRSAAGLILVGAFLATSAEAGGDDKLGTAGAVELRIPVGPRGTALAGATLATASGAEAMYWNPAGIVTEENTDVLLTHTEYLSNMNLEYAALTSHALGGMFGASFKALSLGKIYVTTENAPEGTGEISSPTFSVAQIAYARQMTDKVRFGGSAAVVSERVLQESATGVSFDFGFEFDPQWYDLKFGFVMKNFGPSMQFRGADFENPADLSDTPGSSASIVQLESASFELPSYVSLGASRSWAVGTQGHFELNAVFQNNNFSADEYRGGAEYVIRNAIALRGGYVYSSQDNYIYDWTAGVGWLVPLGDAHVAVDYTYTHVKDFFDSNQAFSVGVRF